MYVFKDPAKIDENKAIKSKIIINLQNKQDCLNTKKI